MMSNTCAGSSWTGGRPHSGTVNCLVVPLTSTRGSFFVPTCLPTGCPIGTAKLKPWQATEIQNTRLRRGSRRNWWSSPGLFMVSVSNANTPVSMTRPTASLRSEAVVMMDPLTG